jgi:signal transduction histidine kinase
MSREGVAEHTAALSASFGEVSPERFRERMTFYQRQATLGSLASIIVHEYRNLLSSAYTRAQHAATCDDVATMRKALTVAVQQMEKMIGLAECLVEIARGREAPSQACSVAKLVEGAATATVRPFEKDKIELDVRVPEELRIQAQPLLFEQVILNLLLNARKAMREHGGKLSVTACGDGDAVVIDVHDGGVGMSPQRLENVINPFLATDPAAQPGDWVAVGLGLNACRTIAQRHGATVRAFANDGPGCTFQLRWPAA